MNKEQAVEIIERHIDNNIASGSLVEQALRMAIDALDVGAEFLRKVLDVVDLVGAEREKYEWGLGLIEACICDIKELSTAQPETPCYLGSPCEYQNPDVVISQPVATDTNVGDTISRQAAIDEIGKAADELYENIKKGATFPQRQWFDGMAHAQSILENLPPVQPEERTETHACDLISRKEVLKAIDGYERISAVSQTVRNMTSLREIVQWLPPVQPEPKTGKWIGTEFDGYADGNPVFYEWQCSECGCIFEDEEPTYKFCPNCGAKMKGETE